MPDNHIFISYSRADLDFARKVAEDLRTNGVNIWMDKIDIPVGAHWDRAVEEALEASGRILLILSPSSVESENVMDEVGEAFGNNKPIIPILYQPCEVPMRIRRLQYIDFTKGYDQALKKLLVVVSKPVPDSKDDAEVKAAVPPGPVIQNFDTAGKAGGMKGWMRYAIGAGGALVLMIALIAYLASGPEEGAETGQTDMAANALNSAGNQPGTSQPVTQEEPLDCVDYGNVSSPIATTEPTTISFLNKRSDTIIYFWINNSGEAEMKGELGPGEETYVKTSINHIWMVADKQDRCLGLFKAPDDIDIQ